MSDTLLKDMLYLCLITGVILVSLLVSFRVTIIKLRQKNYFLNRDRERYAETMYASKDGYFAFVYPDERIKDPRRTIRQRCSRRLAVMLNLKNGIQSDFEDVISSFYKEDAKKLKKYLKLMQEEGIAFEDTFSLKIGARKMSVYGARINANDGNLYCDMLWFRDLSEEMIKIEELHAEREKLKTELASLQDLIDNLSYPVWLRDENLKIKIVNKKYFEYSGLNNLEDIKENDFEFSNNNLAKLAIQTNKEQKQNINFVVGGQAHSFEMAENPFYSDSKLDKISTAGSLYDMTELDNVKRTFKIHQSAHLDVLATLGTAFAIFDSSYKLIFYNKAFLKLWNLKAEFADSTPVYSDFLEKIRNNRVLPEVPDFKGYKQSEIKLFSSLLESKEDMLHISDGRTIKRVVSPHPNGLIFAYEDVSDKLAATRMINELIGVQQNVLDNVEEAILILGTDRKLKYFNNSYIKFWDADEIKLRDLPNLSEIIEMQKTFFTHLENWDNLKENMLRHIISICKAFRLERNDKKIVEVIPVTLSDESIMIKYIIK